MFTFYKTVSMFKITSDNFSVQLSCMTLKIIIYEMSAIAIANSNFTKLFGHFINATKVSFIFFMILFLRSY